MPTPKSGSFRQIAYGGVALIPWCVSLYVLYRLEHDGIWTPQMPLRAVLSAGILALGLAGSFLLHSFLKQRARA
jgi:hypothetical protein